MARRPAEDDELRHGDITFSEEEVEQDFDFDEGDEGEDYISPDDPDYDLSEEVGYSGWEPRQSFFRIPQWLILAISLLLMLALLLPAILRLS